MSAYLEEASNGVNSVVRQLEKWLDQKQWLLILFNTSLCPKALLEYNNPIFRFILWRG